MSIIQLIREMNLDRFSFHPEYFDKIMGTKTVREALERHIDVSKIANATLAGLENFSNFRKPYLLY